jgi:hypothetical protein
VLGIAFGVIAEIACGSGSCRGSGRLLGGSVLAIVAGLALLLGRAGVAVPTPDGIVIDGRKRVPWDAVVSAA